MDKENLQVLLHTKFQQGKNASAAARSIIEFTGQNIVNDRTVRRWFQQFKEGQNLVKRKKGSGRRPHVNRRALRRRLARNPEASTRELSKGLCSNVTAWRWLRSRGRRWRRGRNIPHELTPNQMQNRADTCRELLRRHRRGHLLSRIITCDESWVYYDGRVKRSQWLLPNEPAQPTPIRPGHAKKRMLCLFWNFQGPVYWELLPNGTTVNSDLYCAQLNAVRTAAQVMTAQGLRQGRVVLQQDNARPHTSNQTLRHIQETLGWDLLPHPPYSPDIAPSDYHVFRSLKNFLRGKQFLNDEELENGVGQYFASKLGTDFFTRGIRKLPSRWRLVVMQRGDYLIE